MIVLGYSLKNDNMLTTWITSGSTVRQIPLFLFHSIPDSKVHGANMGPIWGRQDLGGPHVGPMNFATSYSLSDKTGAHAEKLLRMNVYGAVCILCR